MATGRLDACPCSLLLWVGLTTLVVVPIPIRVGLCRTSMNRLGHF